MSSEPVITELVSLIKDTREQLAYFHELGVEHVGTEWKAGDPQKPVASSSEVIPEHLRPVMSPRRARPVSTGAAPAATTPRTSTREHAVATPPPQLDTLFGDLGPMPATIQKSSETFEEIWADVGDCTRCPLYQGRTTIVHTEGNRRARLMFVGEAPGADEDAQARPFVGRAGKLLTKIIEAIGFKREDVLIGNVNRCRPPANRPPTPEEAAMCKPFLLREIAAVQPEVIVVLGNTAMRNLLDIKQGITRVRGQFQDYHGVKVMPTFHPAYLLRDPSKKKETWEDLKKVRDYLDATPRTVN
ncbi:MAG: uracil-DNA glycosylase [Acidobacteriota bacterium]|nr:uracil-DNA glycosylase [Acidobacteriota bacterium]